MRWVLSRIAIEMQRYPRVNETYTLSTWVESWNRHFSIRNFQISDAHGNPLGYASSVWMVLNTETRENAGLGHLHLAPDHISGEAVPIAKPGRHPALNADAPAKRYVFQYGDLDFYRHVNTVRYVTMLLNQFTLAEMDETQVERLELAFMREGRYGEAVDLRRQDEGLQTVFSLADAVDGTPLLSAALTRRPRKCS